MKAEDLARAFSGGVYVAAVGVILFFLLVVVLVGFLELFGNTSWGINRTFETFVEVVEESEEEGSTGVGKEGGHGGREGMWGMEWREECREEKRSF